MGGGIGDNIVGMTALNIFYDRLMNYFKEVDIGVFTLRPRGLPVLKQETIVNEIYLMPSPTELLFSYDAYVDLSRMTGWPIFKQEMVDFYLQAMSIDPASVPKKEKRCFVKINEKVARELDPIIKALRVSGRKLLLFHPLSSSEIRSIPKKFINKYLHRILEITDYLVVSLLDLPFKHSRFISLAHVSKQGFDHYAYLVSQMDAIITVDTATYHIADGFAIPTVVLFTSVPPEHRISYYPFEKGILIGGKDGKPVFYKHASEKEEDVKQIEACWRRFKIDQTLEILKELEEKRRNIEKYPCPVCENSVPFIPTDRYRTYRLLRCSVCEAEFAWPRKGHDYEEAYREGKNDIAQYGHYIASQDTEQDFLGHISQPRFQKVREFLENLPIKKTLLDVGCANGFFVRYAKNIGFRAYGIDVSKSAVEWGKRHFGLKRSLACTNSLKELPYSFPERFQVITAFQVLEHLEDPLSFVCEVFERLEEGGIFIFSTPNRTTMGRILGQKDERVFFIKGRRDEPPNHLTRFTARTHQILVKRAGLKVLWQWAVPPLPDDLTRALGDDFKIPDLNLEINSQKIIKLDGEKLKPLILQTMTPVLSLLQDQGLFLITAAFKE